MLLSHVMIKPTFNAEDLALSYLNNQDTSPQIQSGSVRTEAPEIAAEFQRGGNRPGLKPVNSKSHTSKPEIGDLIKLVADTYLSDFKEGVVSETDGFTSSDPLITLIEFIKKDEYGYSNRVMEKIDEPYDSEFNPNLLTEKKRDPLASFNSDYPEWTEVDDGCKRAAKHHEPNFGPWLKYQNLGDGNVRQGTRLDLVKASFNKLLRSPGAEDYSTIHYFLECEHDDTKYIHDRYTALAKKLISTEPLKLDEQEILVLKGFNSRSDFLKFVLCVISRASNGKSFDKGFDPGEEMGLKTYGDFRRLINNIMSVTQAKIIAPHTVASGDNVVIETDKLTSGSRLEIDKILDLSERETTLRVEAEVLDMEAKALKLDSLSPNGDLKYTALKSLIGFINDHSSNRYGIYQASDPNHQAYLKIIGNGNMCKGARFNRVFLDLNRFLEFPKANSTTRLTKHPPKDHSSVTLPLRPTVNWSDVSQPDNYSSDLAFSDYAALAKKIIQTPEALSPEEKDGLANSDARKEFLELVLRVVVDAANGHEMQAQAMGIPNYTAFLTLINNIKSLTHN